MNDEHESPIKTWRVAHGMTVGQLATACGMAEPEVHAVEVGNGGIPGEMQDYLTKRGENVSWLASEQSAFVADLQRLH